MFHTFRLKEERVLTISAATVDLCWVCSRASGLKGYQVRAKPILGGLHQEYRLEKMAA